MKIYTKTGDRGSTGLFGGARVSKAALRVSVYGQVDELNSVLGVVRAIGAGSMDPLLHRLQCELFDVGAELATTPGREPKGFDPVGTESIERIENAIDSAETNLPALKTFILPGGCMLASQLHVARTVCRRVERELVALATDETESVQRDELVMYINRLSDLLFTLARLANHEAGVDDVAWVGTKDRN